MGSVSAAFPTEVQNVAATVEGTSINLTWDAATAPEDSITAYRVYWGTKSVQAENDFYTTDFTVTPAATNFTIPDLAPGTTYYIAVTAVNSLDDESETYSQEISTRIPTAEGESLKVISAKQNAQKGIEVTLSAPVTIDIVRDGFFVTDLADNSDVRVIGGVVQKEHVLLSMAEMIAPGHSYKVTATSLVKDSTGTPIKSGITDTITFVAEWSDTETSAKPTQPEIIIEEDTENDLDLLDETPLEEAPETTTDEEEEVPLVFPELTTPPLTEPEAPIVLDVPDLFPSESGTFDPDPVVNEKEEAKPSAPTADHIAPIDATNFIADTSTVPSEKSVLLSWEKSLNISNDVVDQILYVRENLGDWDDGYSIGPNLEEIMLDVEDEFNYQVKIVTMDKNGNRSNGATVSFSTQLPQSGPAGMFGAGAALIVLVVLGLTVARRRTV